VYKRQPLVSHGLQLRYVRRSAIFSVERLLHEYLRILLVTACAGLATALWLSAVSATDNVALKILLVVAVVSAAGGILWSARLSIPPIKIARRYGIFEGLG